MKGPESKFEPVQPLRLESGGTAPDPHGGQRLAAGVCGPCLLALPPGGARRGALCGDLAARPVRLRPEPTVEEADLSELCAAAGWQKVCGWGNMMIYANDQPDPVPLITDERLRLQNLHAAMKKGSLPGMGVVFGVSAALALLLWPIWAVSYRTAPDVHGAAGRLRPGAAGHLAAQLLGLVSDRPAGREGKPPLPGQPGGGLAGAGLAGRRFVPGRQIPVSGMVSDPRQFWYSLCFMAGLIGLGFLGDGVRRFLRENGSSKAGNIAAALVAALVCAVALVFALQLLFPA